MNEENWVETTDMRKNVKKNDGEKNLKNREKGRWIRVVGEREEE